MKGRVWGEGRLGRDKEERKKKLRRIRRKDGVGERMRWKARHDRGRKEFRKFGEREVRGGGGGWRERKGDGLVRICVWKEEKGIYEI